MDLIARTKGHKELIAKVFCVLYSDFLAANHIRDRQETILEHSY